MSKSVSTIERCRGCLLGGAVGDALGAPVEFMDIAEIRRRFGPAGIREFAPAYGRLGAITDDTQMTLFTAEGLLLATLGSATTGTCSIPIAVHQAYVRWLNTQGETPNREGQSDPKGHLAADGWLISVPALRSRRAPGNTCLSALRNPKQWGAPARNNSKGCGGVMRVAPVGLVFRRERAFELGCETAALTHGHPSGYLSAGFLALIIEELLTEASLRDAIQIAKESLITRPGHEEVLAAVVNAEVAAQSGTPAKAELGQGWVAEEALSIALYCSLAAPSFEEAIVWAVNHSGDSDSTGAITGNICGALYGDADIPIRWLRALELREEIITIAEDLAALHSHTLDLGHESPNQRYPSR